VLIEKQNLIHVKI